MSDLRTFRPGGARFVAYGASVLIVLLTIVIGLSLPPEVTFSAGQTGTLWVVILIVLAVLHGVGRSFVRATDEGVEVLNGYRRHVVPWSQIEGFAMNTGAPWPTMVTANDERVMLFAIQGSDGPSAHNAVVYLRKCQP